MSTNMFKDYFKGTHLKNRWHDYHSIVGAFDIFGLRNTLFDFFSFEFIIFREKVEFSNEH